MNGKEIESSAYTEFHVFSRDVSTIGGFAAFFLTAVHPRVDIGFGVVVAQRVFVKHLRVAVHFDTESVESEQVSELISILEDLQLVKHVVLTPISEVLGILQQELDSPDSLDLTIDILRLLDKPILHFGFTESANKPVDHILINLTALRGLGLPNLH